jgi:hypothetical protein
MNVISQNVLQNPKQIRFPEEADFERGKTFWPISSTQVIGLGQLTKARRSTRPVEDFSKKQKSVIC